MVDPTSPISQTSTSKADIAASTQSIDPRLQEMMQFLNEHFHGTFSPCGLEKVLTAERSVVFIADPAAPGSHNKHIAQLIQMLWGEHAELWLEQFLVGPQMPGGGTAHLDPVILATAKTWDNSGTEKGLFIMLERNFKCLLMPPQKFSVTLALQYITEEIDSSQKQLDSIQDEATQTYLRHEISKNQKLLARLDQIDTASGEEKERQINGFQRELREKMRLARKYLLEKKSDVMLKKFSDSGLQNLDAHFERRILLGAVHTIPNVKQQSEAPGLPYLAISPNVDFSEQSESAHGFEARMEALKLWSDPAKNSLETFVNEASIRGWLQRIEAILEALAPPIEELPDEYSMRWFVRTFHLYSTFLERLFQLEDYPNAIPFILQHYTVVGSSEPDGLIGYILDHPHSNILLGETHTKEEHHRNAEKLIRKLWTTESALFLEGGKESVSVYKQRQATFGTGVGLPDEILAQTETWDTSLRGNDLSSYVRGHLALTQVYIQKVLAKEGDTLAHLRQFVAEFGSYFSEKVMLLAEVGSLNDQKEGSAADREKRIHQMVVKKICEFNRKRSAQVNDEFTKEIEVRDEHLLFRLLQNYAKGIKKRTRKAILVAGSCHVAREKILQELQKNALYCPFLALVPQDDAYPQNQQPIPTTQAAEMPPPASEGGSLAAAATAEAPPGCEDNSATQQAWKMCEVIQAHFSQGTPPMELMQEWATKLQKLIANFDLASLDSSENHYGVWLHACTCFFALQLDLLTDETSVAAVADGKAEA